MAEPLFIEANEGQKDITDFDFLKENGIEFIQSLSGNIWTDYNIHDPGITILEYLCFALTELGYRSRYSVKDILSTILKKDDVENLLLTPSEILSCKPVTISDFRKLILDIDGVKNVYFSKQKDSKDFNGIYDVLVELFPEFDDEFNRKIIEREIAIELEQNRNLCESFTKIKFVEYLPVSFIIDVEIDGDFTINSLLISILASINEYISPTIRFYGLKEMIDKGYKVEEVFNGPLLKNGFIIEKELEELKYRSSIYASDIIHDIMDIEGVSTVRNLDIIFGEERTKWVGKVKEGFAPKFDLENTFVRFFHKGKSIQEKNGSVTSLERLSAFFSKKSAHKNLKFEKHKGEDINLGEYNSIQNDFPATYGIGQLGLSPYETDARKAQAKQLKAYLLFFEQMLANYFAQLENLGELFSIRKISNTYFSQPLLNVPGVEFFYKPFINYCFINNIKIDEGSEIRREWKLFIKKEETGIQEELNGITEDSDTFS
jgi:hypothetical protein